MENYSLTITAVIALFICLSLAFATLINLVVTSVEKAREIRQELFDRDLREIAGRFDADERFVLAKNLPNLISTQRIITPLILPRQYYTALPKGSTPISPRQPPRNCYVDLIRTAPKNSVGSSNIPDRFCAYFADSRAFGRFLFFSMSFVDRTISPLISGDIRLHSDAIGITLKSTESTESWWLTLQVPKIAISQDRYELSAFRITAEKHIERDKRIEGWAYTQRQANGEQIVSMIARMDMRAILPSLKGKENAVEWPPKGGLDIAINVRRKDKGTDPRPPEIIEYKNAGNTNLSISSLSLPFVNSYATLDLLELTADNKTRDWTIPPPPEAKSKIDEAKSYIRFVDGDLLIRQSPIVKKQPLPDTLLSFSARHPGTVIEKSIWQTAILLFTLLIGFIAFACHFFLQVLKPIVQLSRQSRQLMQGSLATSAELPYSKLTNEIGTLSRGFNELLRETRAQSSRAIEEREKRAERERIDELEKVRVREENLKIIGHEIRSPLQALSAMHKHGDLGKHHVDRMIRAVTNLFGTSGPEAAFNSVPVNLEPLDVAEFLHELTVTAVATGEFQNIQYEGPLTEVMCLADQGILEDAIANILTNASRHRVANTPVKILLSSDTNTARISICNEGNSIPDELISKIFTLYFSDDQKDDPSRQGIGLFAARNYISRMAGHLTARNTSTGVCFDIQLSRLPTTSTPKDVGK